MIKVIRKNVWNEEKQLGIIPRLFQSASLATGVPTRRCGSWYCCWRATAFGLPGAQQPPRELDRREIGPYYVPKKEDGTFAKFLKAKPQTDWDKCVHCSLCARFCPLSSIDGETMEAPCGKSNITGATLK